MRQGYNPKLLFSGKKFIGVSLGADYCAEHEYGIRDLQGDFCLNTDPLALGIDRRIVRCVPKNLQEFSAERDWGFGYVNYGKITEHLHGELKGVGLRGAWSDKDFGVVSDVTTAKKHLRVLFEAFREKNAVITFVAGRVFLENHGLCLAIADRMPKKITTLWFDTDKERYVLAEAMKQSGIEKLLAQKGKGYFALSPRRMQDGNIKFNLNPYDQENNNWGFFSLEELQQWAEGYGPIPKNPTKIA